MTFSAATQASLIASNKSFKSIAESMTPYQNILAKNLKLPALKDVPVHVDLEIFEGFVFSDTREAQLQKLVLLWKVISKTLIRSPILVYLKSIYYNELLKLAPSLTSEERKKIGLDFSGFKDKREIASIIKHFVDTDRLEDAYQLITALQIQMPKSYFVSLFGYYDFETVQNIYVKLAMYLRDKPAHFLQMWKIFNYDSLPILVACNYQPEDVSMILQAALERQSFDNILDIINQTLKRQTSYLSDDAIFYQQLCFIHGELLRLNPDLPIGLKEKADLTKSWISMRYNLDDEFHAQATPHYMAAITLMHAGKYDRAVALMPDQIFSNDIEHLFKNREFVSKMLLLKPREWIKKLCIDNQYSFWVQNSLIAAVFGIESVENEFSTVIDMVATGKVSAKWYQMLPTLFQSARISDLKTYVSKMADVNLPFVFMRLFNCFTVLPSERFKALLLELISIVDLYPVSHREESTDFPFDVAQFMINDPELYTAFATLKGRGLPFKFCKTEFAKALNDNQKFMYMMNHRQELLKMIDSHEMLLKMCSSPLEIARAYKFLGDGMTEELFLGQALKYLVEEKIGGTGPLDLSKLSDSIFTFYTRWRRLNKTKTLQDLPKDMKTLEEMAHERAEDKSVFDITIFMTEKQKKNYLEAWLLKCYHFVEY